MLKTILFIFSLYVVVQINAQENSTSNQFDEKLIEEKINAIIDSESDNQKFALNTSLKNLLAATLMEKEAFYHPFEEVKSMSILTPPDSAFRLFSWQIPLSDGTHHFECALLRNRGNGTDLMYLEEINKDSVDLAVFVGNAKEWPGALYYNLVQTKNDFQTYYTLLAWDGNDLLTNKKYIEVLWFDKVGNPKFGAPLFKSNANRTIQNRIVFEFGGQNVMKLTYVEGLNRILYDHLSPSRSSLEGVYEYYGADFSFDAYDWNNGYWIHQSDVDSDLGLKKKKTDFKVDEEVILEKKDMYSPK